MQACQEAIPDFPICRRHEMARSMVENDFILLQQELSIGAVYPHRSEPYVTDDELLESFKQVYIERIQQSKALLGVQHPTDSGTGEPTSAPALPPERLRNFSLKESQELLRFRSQVGSQMKLLQASLEQNP
jgi:hypothetical protein